MYYLPYFLFAKLHQLAIDARRRTRTGRYLVYSVLAGVVAALLFAVGAAFAVLLVVVGLWWLAIPIVLFMALPPIATLAIRHVAVPLGWYRVAYYLGATFARAGKDAAAFGYVCAAWALTRRRRDRAGDAEAWLARHRDARLPLGDAEVVTTGLIAAARGDLIAARQLMASTPMIVEAHPAVRELCGEWLAVDAATRGAWAELARSAETAAFPATPLTWFLEGIAARKARVEGAPGDAELLGRWLLAPHRLTTRALLDEVRTGIVPPTPAAVPIDAPTIAEAELPPDRPPLPRAITALLAVSGDVLPTRIAFAHAVAMWDAALGDGATRAWLALRATELDAPLGAADRALREVTTMVVDDLAALADAAALGAPKAAGPVGDALARRLRHGRLDSLEAGFTRWAQRRADGAVRLAIDEWREFVALYSAYGAAVAVGGTELRRLAFQHAWTCGNKMAAWLWNARNEYALSHAISRWLYDEALAVGDTEAIDLGYRNCQLEIPTRLGRITTPIAQR